MPKASDARQTRKPGLAVWPTLSPLLPSLLSRGLLKPSLCVSRFTAVGSFGCCVRTRQIEMRSAVERVGRAATTASQSCVSVRPRSVASSESETESCNIADIRS